MSGRGVERRRFLQGAAAALGTAAAGGAAAGRAVARADGTGTDARIPFEGAHQAGILTPRQAHAQFVAFDVTAAAVAELADLLRTLTERARFLTAGGTPAQLGITAPPSDSGLLGRAGAGRRPDRHRVARCFAVRRPVRARARQAAPAPCDGHLPERRPGPRAGATATSAVQLCAATRDTVLHALRDITRHTRGALQPRWRMTASSAAAPLRHAAQPAGVQGRHRQPGRPRRRRDGPAGLGAADSGEPGWATGGSYQVVRLIRMLVEFWDRVSITEQERMFGRRRDTGAPLDGRRRPTPRPTPTTRTARSSRWTRTSGWPTRAPPRPTQQRILRRGYNYDRGLDANGNLDMGLVFCCYQQDLDRQFETVQKRLAGEPLVDYISPFGGGYFFALPGVRDRSDWYAARPARALTEDSQRSASVRPASSSNTATGPAKRRHEGRPGTTRPMRTVRSAQAQQATSRHDHAPASPPLVTAGVVAAAASSSAADAPGHPRTVRTGPRPRSSTWS